MSSSKISLPKEFKKNIQDLLGNESEAFFDALELTPKSSVRINPYKNSFISGEPISWSKNGFILSERPSFTLDPTFHAGSYYVQESSSVFIEHILYSLNIPKGIYLDLCAAPGGKSTLLSSYLGSEGMLVSNEVIKSRASVLKENIIKWGLGNTVVTNNDPAHFESLEGLFNLVMIDAPCSGEGMFRKDQQAREEWSPDNVQICTARQERILNHSGALVAAGGYIIYSTCTFNRHENEENLRYLAEEFSYEPVRIPMEENWGIVESKEEIEGQYFYSYRFYPHKVEGEGFFITVLKRPDDAYLQNPKRSKDFKHPFIQRITDTVMIREATGMGDEWIFYGLKDSYFALKSQFQHYFEMLTIGLNIRYFGVEIGKLNKDQLIPAHEFALSILPKDKFRSYDINLEEALKYLRKEELTLDANEEGWLIVTYKNLPIGWVKNIGNRINNYYPKDWRIRMK